MGTIQNWVYLATTLPKCWPLNLIEDFIRRDNTDILSLCYFFHCLNLIQFKLQDLFSTSISWMILTINLCNKMRTQPIYIIFGLIILLSASDVYVCSATNHISGNSQESYNWNSWDYFMYFTKQVKFFYYFFQFFSSFSFTQVLFLCSLQSHWSEGCISWSLGHSSSIQCILPSRINVLFRICSLF